MNGNEHNMLRRLAKRGILLGLTDASYKALGMKSERLPLVEIDFANTFLSNEEVIRRFLEQNADTLVWRVRIETVSNKQLFQSLDWIVFISLLIEQSFDRSIILLNFHRSIEYDSTLLDAIVRFNDDVFPVRCFLEFEHSSWKSKGVQERLHSLKLPHVFLDAPRLFGIIKDVSYHYGRTALLRCLGRNGRAWFEKAPANRFDYLYSNDELREIAKRVSDLRNSYDTVGVIVANHPSVNAYLNLQRLSQLLDATLR